MPRAAAASARLRGTRPTRRSHCSGSRGRRNIAVARRAPASRPAHQQTAKQHQVTYAGYFANALGQLNLKPEGAQSKTPETPKPKWVRWRQLVLRTWAVDPELCPRCRKQMKRAKALLEQHELQRLLKNLGIGLYPTRPRSPPPPDQEQELLQDSQFSDNESQVPLDWDQWDAA